MWKLVILCLALFALGSDSEAMAWGKDFALQGTYSNKQIKQRCDQAGGSFYNDTSTGTYGCSTGVGIVDCKDGKCTGDCKSCRSAVMYR
jgi:hypothetical protein